MTWGGGDGDFSGEGVGLDLDELHEEFGMIGSKSGFFCTMELSSMLPCISYYSEGNDEFI